MSDMEGSPASPAPVPAPSPDPLDHFSDEAFSWFKLVYAITYIIFGFVFLALFFRARNVFEIRARSVYLVTTLGALLLLKMGLSVDLHCIVLFGTPSDYFLNVLFVFFLMFSTASCYFCRVFRLAVGFSPKLRRSVPKLSSEKLHITFSLSAGVLSVAIPVYYNLTVSEADYRTVMTEVTWLSSLTLDVLVSCLLPIVWYIDDLYHISRELIVIIVLGLIESVFVKLYQDGKLTDEARVVINPPNMTLLTNSVLFGLSIVDPIRRLKFSPMAGTVATRRRERRARYAPSGTGSMQVDPSLPSDGSCSGHMWTFDKIAANESVALAFQAFAKRALCQESIWFLEEVRRFQNEDYTIAAPLGGGKREAFEAITKRFIEHGAPDEVNVCYNNKRAIMNVYMYSSNEGEGLESADDDLSGVFDLAYDEVRVMIESNLLDKFSKSDEAREAQSLLPAGSRRTMRLSWR